MATRLLTLATIAAALAAACDQYQSNFRRIAEQITCDPCKLIEYYGNVEHDKQDRPEKDDILLKDTPTKMNLSSSERKSITLLRNFPQPFLLSNMNNSNLVLEPHSTNTLCCMVIGLPEAAIKWEVVSQDKQQLDPNTKGKLELRGGNTSLHIISMGPDLQGRYSCFSEELNQRKSMIVLLEDPTFSSNAKAAYVIVGAFFLVAAGIIVFVVYRIWKIRRKLHNSGILSFERGTHNVMNPELPISEQAQLLPYDMQWEFPRDKVILGKLLGVGSFGPVYQAQAYSIKEGEAISTVAAKTANKDTDLESLMALASELKIMTRMGRHLNLVNLLGACTRNIVKLELLVLVEFCPFGNMYDHLKRNRKNFVSEVDPTTGELDFTLAAKIRQQCAEHMRKNGAGDTVITVDAVNSSVENLLKSSQTPAPPINTRDLVYWSFQVARGMHYLSSIKVIHGDLAARNVLLARDNIVKICDYGLTKNMSHYCAKKNDLLLPLRWMAPESLKSRTFTLMSDVWSFGVVVWEFFTMAATPYHCMELEVLYDELRDGFRLDEPDYSTSKIYRLMHDCWQMEPKNRPNFHALAERIGDLLEGSVVSKHASMENEYVDSDTRRSRGGGGGGVTKTVTNPRVIPSLAITFTESKSPDGGVANLASVVSTDTYDAPLYMQVVSDKTTNSLPTHTAIPTTPTSTRTDTSERSSENSFDNSIPHTEVPKSVPVTFENNKFQSSLEHPGVIILTTSLNAVRCDPLPPIPTTEQPNCDSSSESCEDTDVSPSNQTQTSTDPLPSLLTDSTEAKNLTLENSPEFISSTKDRGPLPLPHEMETTVAEVTLSPDALPQPQVTQVDSTLDLETSQQLSTEGASHLDTDSLPPLPKESNHPPSSEDIFSYRDRLIPPPTEVHQAPKESNVTSKSDVLNIRPEPLPKDAWQPPNSKYLTLSDDSANGVKLIASSYIRLEPLPPT